MSVRGPSYATSPRYNHDDSRETSVESVRSSSFGKENSKVDNAITSAFIANFKGPPTPIEICMSIITGLEKFHDYCFPEMETDEDDEMVSKKVLHYVQRWGRVVPVHPLEFLKNILKHRGYQHEFVPSLSLESRRLPTRKQLEDYDNELVWAIRNSDLKKLEELFQAGKSLTACNRYSESIVHMACRRAEKPIVQFLIQNGADLTIIDDFGRTPLHDACWRPEPRFDVVTLIMDHNPDLIRLADRRGSIPLNYVREEHWVQWCAYLFNQIEKYWPMKQSTVSESEQLAKRQRTDNSIVC